MMKIKLAITALLMTLSGGFAAAQQTAQRYASPVNFPTITLAGNVGEIRSDHFHTGIDIKAQQGVGSPVLAAADGYVWRIYVSPTGYGKALYVMHPNGEVTLYGHLDGFNSKIAAWVRSQQYARQSFFVDLYPSSGQFPVTRGQQIARLGNSGSSGGPHLHFEVREAGTGNPVNLLAHGMFTVADHQAPVVSRIFLYEVDTVQGVPYHRLVQSTAVTRGLTPVMKMSPGSRGYLAYELVDLRDGLPNTMGIYSLEQRIDSAVNFAFAIDKISFANSAYVTTMTAYAAHKASRVDVLRSYISPNNTLGFYRSVVRRGIIDAPAPGTVQRAEVTATDDCGNKTTVRFSITSDASLTRSAPELPASVLPVDWARDFTFGNALVKVDIPARTLYESLLLAEPTAADEGWITVAPALYGENDIPLVKSFTLLLRECGDIPPALRPKALVIRATGTEGGKTTFANAGGSYDAATGGVRTSSSSFGRFKVAIDTIAPVITPKLVSGAAVPSGSVLGFTVTDDLSGIASYRLEINGQWELLEYDPKTRTMFHTPVRGATAVRRGVVLTVRDARGNVRTFRGNYAW